MPSNIPDEIYNDEFLYRGIIEKFWDYENNRATSAVFKDSFGVSVDRDFYRDEKECVKALLSKRDFFGVCKVLKSTVLEFNAIVKYKAKIDNIYHSEIHDSEERAQLKGKKPSHINKKAILVHLA